MQSSEKQTFFTRELALEIKICSSQIGGLAVREKVSRGATLPAKTAKGATQKAIAPASEEAAARRGSYAQKPPGIIATPGGGMMQKIEASTVHHSP